MINISDGIDTIDDPVGSKKQKIGTNYTGEI